MLRRERWPRVVLLESSALPAPLQSKCEPCSCHSTENVAARCRPGGIAAVSHGKTRLGIPLGRRFTMQYGENVEQMSARMAPPVCSRRNVAICLAEFVGVARHLPFWGGLEATLAGGLSDAMKPMYREREIRFQ